jgi:hypothetical protein
MSIYLILILILSILSIIFTLFILNFNIEIEKRNYINNTFTGLKWECVEYVRRYLILNKGITFNEIDNAYQIFNLDYFIDIYTNKKIKIYKHYNGSNIIPNIGSLLIWDKYLDKNRTGHIAIITHVSDKYIELVEQNWKNSKNRRIKVDIINNGYYIKDGNIIGWINI